jgi:hypothetical protein
MEFSIHVTYVVEPPSGFLVTVVRVGRGVPHMAEFPPKTVDVVIPAAAARRPDQRVPTWCLERPDGSLVIESVIRPLDLTHVRRVVPVMLRADIDEFCGGDTHALEAHLEQTLGAAVLKGSRVTVVQLDQPTGSAGETVQAAIRILGLADGLFIKDCDGCFEHTVQREDCVVCLKISSVNARSLHDLPSKSFVEECGGVLTNIVEKHIVNDLVCLGGYGFQSADAFLRALTAVQRAAQDTKLAGSGSSGMSPVGRIFNSHLVLHLLLAEGAIFRVVKAPWFDDWKTQEAWVANARHHRNIVVQLEGVLLRLTSNGLAARINESLMRSASTSAASPCSMPAPLSNAGPAGSFSSPADSSSPAGGGRTPPVRLGGASTRMLDEFVPIAANIDALRRAVATTRTQVVVLSSRPERLRSQVEALLREYDIPFDALVLGLQSATTTLIGAHDGLLLPHPAANSLSIPFGADALDDVL